MDTNRKVSENFMITLFEQDIKTADRQSSKGNQLKWYRDDLWYKADYTGYEGLVEYTVSKLLKISSLKENEICLYDTVDIQYKRKNMLGCSSQNFLPNNWQLITLERLFHNHFSKSLSKAMYSLTSYEERIQYLVNRIIGLTGLTDFGSYMSKLITIDAFFLNEDRHTHNITVLLDDSGNFHYCPIFDNGASLLSDTTLDYPLDEDTFTLIHEVKSKTFCRNFDEQLDIIEKLYGEQIKFHFTKQDIMNVLEEESLYPKEIKNRVMDILFYQYDTYRYLFD